MEGALLAAPDPDVQAVQRCRAGEADAFAEIVERHQAAVYGTALRLIGDRDAALEVANTAFYKAYRALASLDLTRPLRPWLVKIASNEALNYLRDQGRTARQTLAGEAGQAALEALPSAQADPEAGALVRERRGGGGGGPPAPPGPIPPGGGGGPPPRPALPPDAGSTALPPANNGCRSQRRPRQARRS